MPSVPALRWQAFAQQERELRNKIQGTVFQPGLVESYPGLLTVDDIVEDMALQFTNVSAVLPWASAKSKLSATYTSRLQAYWVDTQLRGKDPGHQGPEWKSMRRAKLGAAAGLQRFAGDSKRGLDHLLEPGLGKEEHMRQALLLSSPFKPSVESDDDTTFAVKALALLGPYLGTWRRQQVSAFKKCVRAVKGVAMALAQRRHRV